LQNCTAPATPFVEMACVSVLRKVSNVCLTILSPLFIHSASSNKSAFGECTVQKFIENKKKKNKEVKGEE
jgi:hypothetical protein